MWTRAIFALPLCWLLTLAPVVSAQPDESIDNVKFLMALREAGAIVGSDSKGYVSRISLSGLKKVDSLLDLLSPWSRLEVLELAGSDVSDQGLEKIKGLTQLRVLNLASTEVGDKGAAHLSGLTKLQELSLYKTRVGDNGLKCVAGMKELRTVIVTGSKITLTGASKIAKDLPELWYIGLKPDTDE